MHNIVNRKQKRLTLFFRTLGIMLFGLVLAVGFVLGCILFNLRPKKSDLENRELTKFPKITADGFLSGEYTSGISTWFADTFPFREGMVKAEWGIQNAYGIAAPYTGFTKLHYMIREAIGITVDFLRGNL